MKIQHFVLVFMFSALVGCVAPPKRELPTIPALLPTAIRDSGWKVSYTSDIGNFSIDFNSIKKHTPKTITYIGKFSYIDSRPAIKEYYEVNCAEMKTRVLESLKNIDGGWTPISPITPDWLNEQPGLRSYDAVESVCITAKYKGLI